MAGDNARAQSLANDVLAMLDANPDEAETAYWLGATRSEALLLLGKETEARAALAEAIGKAPQAYEDHAATIGQFRLVTAEMGADAGWLERYQPPASLHFQGVMRLPEDESALCAEVDGWLAAHNVGFGYGALAAGADILIAEALLARGGELHVILPCDRKNFRAQSVAAIGEDWASRFDALMEQADTVDYLAAADAPLPNAVRICEAVCQGLARQNARNLQSEALALRMDRRHEKRAQQRLSDWIASGGAADTITIHESGGSRPEGQADEGQLAALLALAGAGVSPDGVEGQTARHEIPGGVILQFSTLTAARSAMTALQDDTSKCAIDQGIVTSGIESSALFARCRALLETAEEGQVSASKAAAFALLAADDDIRVEEAGEIRSSIGSFPVYAIISSS